MANHKDTKDEATPAPRPGHDKHGRPGLRMGDHVFGIPAQPRVTGPMRSGQPGSGKSPRSALLPGEERGRE